METNRQPQPGKEFIYRIGMKKGKIVLDSEGRAIPSRKWRHRRGITRHRMLNSWYSKLLHPAPFVSARLAWPFIGVVVASMAGLFGWLVLALAAVPLH